MFPWKKEEPVKRELQGEDFDIFPDLGDRPKQAPESVQANEPIEEDDPGPTDLQVKIAEIPEKKWKLYQWLAGGVLGILCSFFITFGDKLFGGSVGLILAFAFAIVLPGIAEKQMARSAPKLRIVLAITLLVCMVLSFLYGRFINPDFYN